MAQPTTGSDTSARHASCGAGVMVEIGRGSSGRLATNSPAMSEAEVIRTMREHLDSLFPKVCSNCNRSFSTLREYILTTQPLGAMISVDAEAGDWDAAHPVGTLAYANCPCGSTLALTTEGMPLDRRRLLLQWIRNETKQRGLSPQELLGRLRAEIRRQVLGEPDQGNI
jgi:hypothetical protein